MQRLYRFNVPISMSRTSRPRQPLRLPSDPVTPVPISICARTELLATFPDLRLKPEAIKSVAAKRLNHGICWPKQQDGPQRAAPALHSFPNFPISKLPKRLFIEQVLLFAEKMRFLIEKWIKKFVRIESIY